MATLHRDSWEQYAAIMQAEAAEMEDEIVRLREALGECAANYISPPCTVGQGTSLLAEEFRRRMNIAAEALSVPAHQEQS